jgi:hypothetical protein
MKCKRFSLLLALLLSAATAASAVSAALDEAISPLLDGRGAVHFSVTMAVNALPPFDQTRLDLINRVLKHAALDVQMDLDAEKQTTAFQLSLGNDELMAWTEQNQSGAYLLQTSLLPNRMLFSTHASPMDTLLAASDAEPADEEEITSSLNDSDAEEAFDLSAALREIEDCYQALLNQTLPLTEKNTANYTIENIGKGRISYVAKLTAEQSGAMLNELRALLSCGMDATYREELAQVTFAGGFVVALYQNADAEDVCVYLKGTIIYPSGDRRTVKWQWAFTPDKETQTYTYEAVRESGTRDTRVISSILTQTAGETAFTREEKTVVTLKRSSLTETSTLTVDLQGEPGDAATCKGSVKRATEALRSGESVSDTETVVTVDLALAATDGGVEPYGAATYSQIRDGVVQMELALTFPRTVAVATGEAETAASEGSPVVISITPADPAVAESNAETPTVTAEETQAVRSEFLVGTAPLGLYDYEIPAEMTTVNLDGTEAKVHQSLMNEAAQRLAGNLISAILDLPAEDRGLLSDGMTEEDYAVFLAMLQ